MVFTSRFDGRVVAKMPFVPISLLQGISHRNLGGDDYSECSFIFLYILCTMSIRQVGLASEGQSSICLSERVRERERERGEREITIH